MADHIPGLKAGDRVWIGTPGTPQLKLGTVAKLTNTQVVLEPGNHDLRYDRTTGRAIGWAAIHNHPSLQKISTQEEEAAFFEERRNREAERERVRREVERREALRAELNTLLAADSGIWVGDCYSGSLKGHTFELRNLSEEEVRLAIGALRHSPPQVTGQ